MGEKQYQKPLDINEQVDNLKMLGLEISNEQDVRNFLNDVSYFRLIKAFSVGLKEKNKPYNPGTTFEEIKNLYLFNCKFRQALFEQIEKVEINLRCRISNYFSVQYGNFGYEDANNFKDAEYHSLFLDDMNDELSRNTKSPFVKNFQENYVDGKLPLYALIELFSFGTLSKFYKNMKNEDKKVIAKTYGIGYTYFESWIEHIAFVRNICAHYGRIYNVNLPKTPILYKEYDKQDITSKRIYATLICLKYILPNDRHWNDFIDQIDLLFDRYPCTKKELMGFPQNWKELLLAKS